jgi:hypothetical protein
MHNVWLVGWLPIQIYGWELFHINFPSDIGLEIADSLERFASPLKTVSDVPKSPRGVKTPTFELLRALPAVLGM